MCTQNSTLFGSPVSGESGNDVGFFGTSLSKFSGCSIFGEPSSTQANQQQTTAGSAEFSFSFGAMSPNDSTPNRSSTFCLF